MLLGGLLVWPHRQTPHAFRRRRHLPVQDPRGDLDNGRASLVIPYDSPGTVAYYTVRTGSRDEVEPGYSGFAHFFEHMMFRGTDRYAPAGNDILKKMGADSNASTSDDLTVYHIVGPSAELATMMDLESDRFSTQVRRGVPHRGPRRARRYNKSASNPFAPMNEKVRDLAYQKHTYKHTTIGFLADVKAMPDYYQYSLQFFQRYYRPENCTVLVVGDVQPETVFGLARKLYGDWKKGYTAPDVPVEPPQTEAEGPPRLAQPDPPLRHDRITSLVRSQRRHRGPRRRPALAESAPLVQGWRSRTSGSTSCAEGPTLPRPGLFTIVARSSRRTSSPR